MTAPTDTQIGTMGAFSGIFAPTDTQIGTVGAFPGGKKEEANRVVGLFFAETDSLD